MHALAPSCRLPSWPHALCGRQREQPNSRARARLRYPGDGKGSKRERGTQPAINRPTAERCQEFSQGYAFFAYPWKGYTTSAVPREGCEESSTPVQGAIAFEYTQAYAKNAYAWLISQHPSGGRRALDWSGAAESN